MWLTIVEKETGRVPVVYASRAWWLELLGQFIPEPAGMTGGLFYLYQGPLLE
jgi:hypothetical protein